MFKWLFVKKMTEDVKEVNPLTGKTITVRKTTKVEQVPTMIVRAPECPGDGWVLIGKTK